MLPKGWSRRRLRELISEVNAGVSVNGEERPATSKEVGVLKVSCVSSGTFIPLQNKAIHVAEVALARTSPKADRVIVSRSNTETLVGASAYIPQDYPHLFLSDKLWQLEPSEDGQVFMRWLAYWLASDPVRKILASLGTGTSGSMKNISKEELLSLWVQVPSYPEQQAIATAIGTWDSAIKNAEKLLANSRKQKEALDQALLMGRARCAGFAISSKRQTSKVGKLPLDWKHTPIGELASEVSVKNVTCDSLPVLSCTKHHGLVDSLSYFTKRVFSEDTSTYKVVPTGAFAYATNHIDEGSIGYQDLYDRALISPMYTVFKVSQLIDHGFLFKLLKTEHYRQVFAASTNASVDRRGSLRWKEFKKIEVPVPSLEEQLAICKVLDAATRELEGLQIQLDRLKQEKRALMADLLTGKRRVRIPDALAEPEAA